jgi:hypothetical protein
MFFPLEFSPLLVYECIYNINTKTKETFIERSLMDNYYVYGLIDPYTNLPFYIGKGKNKRAESHLKLAKNDTYNIRKRTYIEKILNEGKEIKIIYYDTGLSDEESKNLEIRLIRKYGRKNIDNNGILLNLAEGGSGGDTSMFFTHESRKKISKSSSGTNNINSKLTEEQVLEIYYSEKSPEELSLFYGISQTQVYGIKRKAYYYSVTKELIEQPGFYKGKKVIRIPITIDAVKSIYLEENSYKYFKDKFSASPQVVKNIKSGKTYKHITKDLGPAGHVIKNKLSNDDVIYIRQSDEQNKLLAIKFGVHPETIYNIKSGRTRKFLNYEY